MNLIKLVGKKIMIEDIDGKMFYGTVTDFFYPEEGEQESESIVLKTPEDVHIEFEKEEIKHIEMFP